MAIRAKRSLPFLQVAHKTLFDTTISIQARFLLMIMLAKPDDWQFSVEWCAKNMQVCDDTARKLLNELQKAGYLIVQKVYNGNGKFIGRAYTVCECKDLNDLRI